ncbi:uncharacterized protein LOC109792104 [Cajanus cajan]|uniref:uncharacterized protein LOC109792104 n=1 Tax=Cajanus cajan TaxID=3821 RepID=UPI00098D7C7B|nr:uncharacterized protein LOC109792104 [Cajanus cajan]
MISGFCKESLFDEVLTMLSMMEDFGSDVVTNEIIIYALFKENENHMAEKLLRIVIARGLL